MDLVEMIFVIGYLCIYYTNDLIQVIIVNDDQWKLVTRFDWSKVQPQINNMRNISASYADATLQQEKTYDPDHAGDIHVQTYSDQL